MTDALYRLPGMRHMSAFCQEMKQLEHVDQVNHQHGVIRGFVAGSDVALLCKASSEKMSDCDCKGLR